MPHVTSHGVRIHYEHVVSPHPEAQGHPPVVLVHGLGLAARFWFDVPYKLAHDAKRPRHVVVLDNRGTGASELPRRPFRIAHMADDVVAVLDAVGAAAATIVGISMGGMIAQEVALRHPGRVTALVLLVTTPGLPHGQLPSLGVLRTLVTLPMARDLRPAMRLLLPGHAVPRGRELLGRWGAAMREAPLRGRTMAYHLFAAALHSTGGRLGRVRAPAVVVGAEEDVLVPPENSRRLARRLPRARLLMLDGAAHGVLFTHPDTIAHALAEVDGV